MPTLFFTDANDSYTVTAAGNYDLVFLDGNDALTVNGGTFSRGVMGEGADVITLQSGDALIYGDGGNDRFEIYVSGIEARGGADNDIFNLRGGNNLVLRGDGGNDRFNFLTGSLNLLLRAGDGDDTLFGNGHTISGNIYGDAGNDTFIGFRNVGGTVPTLRGGLGDDVYRADPTAPANFLELAGQGSDTVQLSAGDSYTLGANIENITVVAGLPGATTGAATLTGNALANVIRGGNNAETINGGDGADTLYGGAGADTLNGGAGNDILDGQLGADKLNGGIGNDIYYTDGGDMITELAGQGIDLVRVISGYTLAANVENAEILSDGGFLGGNSLRNLLTGSIGRDFIDGAAGSDTINGGAEDDDLWGREGNDRIDGGLGVDNMFGGLGDDRYFVDSLFDEVWENPGEGTDTIFLSAPDDFETTLNSYQMPDDVENIVLRTTHPKNVYGNGLANTMTGSSVRDELAGRGGDDTLFGMGGNDSLFGLDGADTISGGNGDDFIGGDGGGTTVFAGDTLTGGAGADTFFYLWVDESAPFIFRADQITDFETGVDTLYLERIDANTNVADDQDWTLVDASTGAAGQMWIDSSDSVNGNYVVFGDSDGGGLADLMIEVHAPNGFSAAVDILF